MKKNLVKLFHLLSVVLILLFLFNCQEPSTESSEENTEENSKKDDSTPSLVGEWLSSYSELFIIAPNETPPMFYSKYNGTTSYAGEIVEHDDYSSASGYITIQYTENLFDPSVIDKFYRIHWKTLAIGTCNISGAYRSDLSGSAQYSADTLEEAKTNFTVEEGAFASYSDCNKQ